MDWPYDQPGHRGDGSNDKTLLLFPECGTVLDIHGLCLQCRDAGWKPPQRLLAADPDTPGEVWRHDERIPVEQLGWPGIAEALSRQGQNAGFHFQAGDAQVHVVVGVRTPQAYLSLYWEPAVVEGSPERVRDRFMLWVRELPHACRAAYVFESDEGLHKLEHAFCCEGGRRVLIAPPEELDAQCVWITPHARDTSAVPGAKRLGVS